MSETKTTYEATVDTEGNLMYQVNEDGVQGAPILEVVGKEVTERNQDSIELSINAKGDYSWTIKTYFDSTHDADALERIAAIDTSLRDKYGRPPFATQGAKLEKGE